MGTVKVTNIEPIADNGTVTLGGSGDTITLGSGATNSLTGLVKIAEKTVASGDASTTAFNFENCFSSTYCNYRAVFDIFETSTTETCFLGLAFGTGSGDFSSGTDFWSGHQFMKIDSSTSDTGNHRYNSSNRMTIFGSVIASNTTGFIGHVDIMSPNDSTYYLSTNGNVMMIHPNYFQEVQSGIETTKTSHTNISFRIYSGQQPNGSSKSTSFTDKPVHGKVQIFGYN